MPAVASKRVTVFCSSSGVIDRGFLVAAAELGAAIAGQRWSLVYGGNNLGSMGAMADACRAAGGKVIGITPRLFVDKGFADRECHELIVTADMRARKAKMEEMADGFITLPGGFGTLEEFSEMLVGRQLKCHQKPVVLLNIAGFYDPLLGLFEKMIAGGFAKEKSRQSFFLAQDVPAAISHLQSHFAQSTLEPISAR